MHIGDAASLDPALHPLSAVNQRTATPASSLARPQRLPFGLGLVEQLGGNEPPRHPAPTATWIIGRDDSSETYTALYYDSRGVSRVYQMSFSEDVWTLWREAPGFWQRFSGTLSDDGSSIRGAWEKSPEGSSWEHDFDMVYTRIK